MKKLISLMLAMLMLGLCACGIAEETEQSGESAFLRIKEGVTAQVFENPGDEQAIDTLPGGRICGLLEEVTTEAGAAWFHVFYLNSQKAGAAGYINAEDAEKLIGDQLKALMEDPAILNEILDLIDALDTYLSKKDGNTKNGSVEQGKEMKTLYEKAMDGLKKLFSSGVSSDLSNLEKEGKELANKAKTAGEKLLNNAKKTGGKLLDKAKKAGKDLKDGLTDALDSMKGKDLSEVVDNLKNSISETIEKWTGGKAGTKAGEVLDNVSDALKELKPDDITDAVNNAKDWLDGTDFSKVNDAVNSITEKVKDGFDDGKESIGGFLDGLKDIFSLK